MRFNNRIVFPRFIPCSRWTELTESIRFQAALAEAARAPTGIDFIKKAG